ncbi:hypothetical protein [Bacillus horti]|uniref:Secreted protein n=1 Tax=Caldalkalibacillus horti TaxID=77523 RepID=A0ABT9VTA8_9BACI|nr:hypothetical protein [Bacillus horti]MDQ0164221.1 hypothetical protein [Bacillus horti]
MRRNSMLPSMLALAGIALAMVQIIRRSSSKPRGWRMITSWFNQTTNQMMSGRKRMMNQIMSGRSSMMNRVRSWARI